VSPTIGQAINGWHPFLWAKCHRSNAEPKIDLRELVRPPYTPVQNLARALFCIKCSGAGRYRVRAHILRLMPIPMTPRMASYKDNRQPIRDNYCAIAADLPSVVRLRYGIWGSGGYQCQPSIKVPS
jgi:hypothetical protein